MRNLLKHPVVVLLLTIFAVLYYVSLDSSAQKATISSATVDVLENDVAQMTTEVSSLEKELEIANYPISKEKVIRNELLMQKPGEYVLQLPPIENSKAPVEKPAKKSAWEEWKEVLF